MARKVDILIAVLALICVFAGFWEETGLLILIAGLVCYLFLYERPGGRKSWPRRRRRLIPDRVAGSGRQSISIFIAADR